MKPRRFTQSAQRLLIDIASFIAADNPNKALEYLSAAERRIQTFDERFLPRRVLTNGQTIYVLDVPGFQGYTLWLVISEVEIVVVAAHRPGLSDAMQADKAKPGLDET